MFDLFNSEAREFVDVSILDNFYQTLSFYPMPVVLCTTILKSGLTNIGSYSLCFPFGISKDHYMMLISRFLVSRYSILIVTHSPEWVTIIALICTLIRKVLLHEFGQSTSTFNWRFYL